MHKLNVCIFINIYNCIYIVYIIVLNIDINGTKQEALPLKEDISSEKVQGVKKATDSTNLLGEITCSVEHTSSIDNNNQDYEIALAKGAVETGDLVNTDKESKPSIYVKVLGY